MTLERESWLEGVVGDSVSRFQAAQACFRTGIICVGGLASLGKEGGEWAHA